MKIVIDIPEEIIFDIKESYMGADVLYCAVKYGTPLPKGNWVAIDDEICEDFIDENDIKAI